MPAEPLPLLATPPRPAKTWEKVLLAVLLVGFLARAKTVLPANLVPLFDELGRIELASAFAQLNLIARAFGGQLVTLALFLGALVVGGRLLFQTTKPGRTIVHAWRVIGRNLHIALFIALITGGTGALLADFTTGRVLAAFGAADNQKALIVTQLTGLLVLTVWGCVVGSWAAATTLYLWVQHEKRRPTSMYEAINFGINRFPRLFPAHAKAFLIVQLGMIVIVPGILFGLQYAFVDAIATLDPVEKDALQRSRKLTSSRRGTLFRTFAVFLVWWVPYQLAMVYELQGAGPLPILIGGAIDHFVLITLDLCMVQYYLDLFRKPADNAVPSTATAPA